MCGISGFISATRQDTLAVVATMSHALRHRGPDQEGQWQNDARTVAFGHTRLSIIDLSELGRQPMCDPESGVTLAFNGEIYNYRELRRELAQLGHSFRSQSDSEVLLRGYIEWGNDVVAKLRGMFTFGIWDPRLQEVLIVRDRLGIKPLYWAATGDGFLFASEIRALLSTGLVKRHLDPAGLASYLWHGFVPGPHTIISDVQRLDPATLMRIDTTGRILEERRYWQLESCDEKLPADEARANSKSHLERALAEHLVSDVPLGVFLSGGVDSSVVAAIAQRQSDRPITTYNIRFDEEAYDESVYARQIAAQIGSDHRELTLTESTFQLQLDDALASLDQPTFDAINTYFVSRAVREAGITVALAGTGGDELFGGYQSFTDLPKASRFTRAMAGLPASLNGLTGDLLDAVVNRDAGEVRPQVRWGKIKDLVAARGDLLPLYQVSYALFSRDFLHTLCLKPPSACAWGLLDNTFKNVSQSIDNKENILENISRLELGSFLGERLLPDTDAASMAVALEARVPLLDHAFVESLQKVSPDLRYEPVGRKQLLRSFVEDQIDTSVFDRPKAGFELPMEVWSKNTLAPDMEAVFQDINLLHAIGLNAEAVGRLWRAFRAGSPGLYWSRLWGLYVLLHWCRKHGVFLR